MVFSLYSIRIHALVYTPLDPVGSMDFNKRSILMLSISKIIYFFYSLCNISGT